MFTHFKNIDTAFRHIKLFSCLFLLACLLLSLFAVYKSYEIIQKEQQKIYVLVNGKALQVFSSDREANLGVELRDHIKMFHHDFFTLDPDDQVIQQNIGKALNLADESAKKAYDNLKEQGFYNHLIAANISQKIQVDSIQLDINRYPYFFKCYASQQLIRASSSVKRQLITQGEVRNVSRSDHNPHGFLIQHWEILSNSNEK